MMESSDRIFPVVISLQCKVVLFVNSAPWLEKKFKDVTWAWEIKKDAVSCPPPFNGF